MGKVAITDAEPGMVLASPAMDKNGRQLIKEGTQLTKVWIDRLAARGVEEIQVVSEEANAASDPHSDIAPVGAAVESDPDSGTISMEGERASEIVERRTQIEGWLENVFSGMTDLRLKKLLHVGALSYFEARGWKEEG